MVTASQTPPVAPPTWPERLFRRSVLKQQKLREICRLLGDTAGLDCLDLGSDNGVVSLLLRRRGGCWHSADIDPTAVASIRELVSTGVHQLTGPRTPFPDDAFDVVVVVDLLEHVVEDAALVADLHRITRPGGRLILNVPHAKDSWLRRLRLRLGQTDERHGHVRHGYTADSLARLLGDRYRLVRHHTYSRFFCEAIDTAITATYGLLKGPQAAQSSKGVLVRGADLARFRTLFRIYSLLYPLFWLASKLDRLLWFASGYMLIAEARSTKLAEAPAAAAPAAGDAVVAAGGCAPRGPAAAQRPGDRPGREAAAAGGCAPGGPAAAELAPTRHSAYAAAGGSALGGPAAAAGMGAPAVPADPARRPLAG